MEFISKDMICQAKGLSYYLISNEHKIQASGRLDVVEMLSHFYEIAIEIFCINNVLIAPLKGRNRNYVARGSLQKRLSQNVASLVHLMLFIFYH